MRMFKILVLLIVVVIGILAVAGAYFSGAIFSKAPDAVSRRDVRLISLPSIERIKIQLLRHATCMLIVGDKMILLDPMLSEAGTMSPVPLTSKRIKNPLIPLPAKAESIVKNIDAVLITHFHFDHFDKAAENLIPKGMLIFCQPEDEKKLNGKGFKNVRVIEREAEWAGIRFKRYPAHHAEGSLLLNMMGTSSSYLLQASGASLFITGDSITDAMLINSLKASNPDVILAYTGSAQMLWGKPITLGAGSLKDISRISPRSKIVAVHMDAINHCRLSKAELRKYLKGERLDAIIAVPDEGEVCSF